MGFERVGKFFHREQFVWFCLQLYSMIISAIIKILNYLKTDEPKPELVKTVFRRINCFKIKREVAVVFFLV
jgi:hypothetical protein